MSDLNPNIATITLNVNTLSTASKRSAGWIKIHNATHFKFKDLGRLNAKR